MEIIKLKAALKDYIWGGTALKNRFGKQTLLPRVAESWELSCHPDGESVITGGQYDGLSLSEYIKKCGDEVLGTNCRRFDFFPVLIKLIDAKSDLSIQVHPDDEYALRTEGGYGKTEMWYVVDCEPGAKLYCGFSRSISKEQFEELIAKGTLESALNEVPVKKGDVFFIKAGTIHAIGAGILIAEIQQNSNTTYRVYDYGRVGADGKPRELHIQKALDVTITQAAPPIGSAEKEYQVLDGCQKRCLSRCDYFTVHEYLITKQASLNADKSSFHSLLCIEGEGMVENGGQVVRISRGDSLFVPAGFGEYRVTGNLTMLHTTV